MARRFVLGEIELPNFLKIYPVKDAFLKKFNGTVTVQNCKRLTGFELTDLLTLSGIFGVHTYIDLSLKQIVDYLRITRISNTLIIDASTLVMTSFIMDIFPAEKRIFFRLLESTGKEPLVGLRILLSQVDVAKKMGFREIEIQAAKYEGKTGSMVGYAVWAKYGFEMDPGSKKEFIRRMRQNNRLEKDLFDLVSTTEGYDLWCRIGFEWTGTISLDENSISYQRFKSYSKKDLRGEILDDFRKE